MISPATRNTHGILAMCCSTCVFVCNDTLVKISTLQGLPAAEIMSIRGVLAATMFGLGILMTRSSGGVPTLRHPLVILRALLDASVAFAFISALPLMPIADLTAVTLIAPILITMASALLFRESVGWRRWLAVLVGFGGMLLIVGPGGANGLQIATLLGLYAAFGVAARDILTRQLPPFLASAYIGWATTIGTAIVGLVLSLFQERWVYPTPTAMACLVGAAALLALGNILVIMAFRNVDVSAVSPFRYTNVVWAIILGYLAFGDVPAPIALFGVLLIVGSGLYTMHRERVRHKAELKMQF